jgi:hypothetical protein
MRSASPLASPLALSPWHVERPNVLYCSCRIYPDHVEHSGVFYRSCCILPWLLGQSRVLEWSCRIYHDYFKFQCVGLELAAHVAVRVDLYMEETWGAVSFAASRALRKVLELVTSQDYVFVVSSTVKCAWLLKYEPGGQRIGGGERGRLSRGKDSLEPSASTLDSQAKRLRNVYFILPAFPFNLSLNLGRYGRYA